MSSHVVPKNTYFKVFGVLMVLLLLTVVAYKVNLDEHLGMPGANLALAMTIAIAKATVIVLFFMHVKYSSRLVWVFAGSSFLWLVIMIGMTASDYMTRGEYPRVSPPIPPAEMNQEPSGGPSVQEPEDHKAGH